jgi:hypothetical protein
MHLYAHFFWFQHLGSWHNRATRSQDTVAEDLEAPDAFRDTRLFVLGGSGGLAGFNMV